MTLDSQANPATIDAESVLSAALKLFGIYMLYSAVFQSAFVMSTLLTIASAFSGPSQVPMQQWGTLATNMVSVIIAAGLAIVLIRHGGRAAHWLSIRADLQVPSVTPTRLWYRGTLVFIGIWVLATNVAPVATTFIWFITSNLGDSPNTAIPNPGIFSLVSFLHLTTLLACGLALVIGARKFGDWLYRLSGAAKFDTATAETS